MTSSEEENMDIEEEEIVDAEVIKFLDGKDGNKLKKLIFSSCLLKIIQQLFDY